MTEKKKGLYANIHAKQERIKNGSGEHMRKVGDEGAPSGKDFDKSAKTARKSPAKKKSAAKTKPNATAKTKTATTAAPTPAKSKRKS